MEIVYAPSPLKGLEILSCSNDHSFAKHLHEGYVLWLNSASDEQFSIEGTTDILRLGTLSIIEPGVIHSNSPCLPGQRHLRSFYFSKQFLQNISSSLPGKNINPHLTTCIINNRQLWRDFSALHELLLYPSDSLSLEVATVSTFSKLFEQDCPVENLPTRSGDKKRVDTVVEYFHDNIDRQFHLDELAELVQCTSYHLIRLFQRNRNIAPHKFLVQLRLEKAKAFLDKGNGIADAALLSGFSDQSHLTRLFKKRYGVTPGLYLKQKNRL